LLADDEPKTTDRLHGRICLLHLDAICIGSFDPYEFIYQFDCCFPEALQMSIARKFNASYHARYLISFRAPDKVIDTYLFKVELIHHLRTHLTGIYYSST
jgi:hypothetical protein